jgi:hypothetical protein
MAVIGLAPWRGPVLGPARVAQGERNEAQGWPP